MSKAWNDLVESLAQRWGGLGARERRMLSLGIAVIALSILYFVLFEPAYLGRLGSEARRLTSVPSGLDNPAALKGLVETSAASAGLKNQLSQVTQTGDLIEARFKAVPFNQWMLWIDSAARETRMRIVDASMIKEGSEGLASGKVVFEVSRRMNTTAQR
jgi:type II secretory pathway component PulM